MTTIDNTQDVIDSRDVIERIEELENMDTLETEETEELDNLRSLRDELEGYCDDWEYGVSIIRESYWVEYVKEMLEDCGYIDPKLPAWIHIDWERTAEEVEADYTTADFDGVTYYASKY